MVNPIGKPPTWGWFIQIPATHFHSNWGYGWLISGFTTLCCYAKWMRFIQDFESMNPYSFLGIDQFPGI